MSVFYPRHFLLIILALAASSFSGCSLLDNFGAYFNTYYNAARLFDEAEAEMLNAPAAPGTAVPLHSLLRPWNTPQSARQKFTSVIEKCSKLLQYHPESNLVDDALLMIGKSYYYQNEHQKAERKFLELIEGFSGSSHVPVAKLLLASSYYKMSDPVKAMQVATALYVEATDEGDDDVAAGAALIQAQVELDNDNVLAAVDAFFRSAESGGTDDERSYAYWRAAELLMEAGVFERASAIYEDARDAAESFDARFRAQLGYAQSLAALGEFDESLEELDDLADQDPPRELLGEVELERANIFRDMGDLESSRDHYVFLDTTFARTEVSARGYYQLGMLYERHLFQYDSARSAYQKGTTAFPSAPVTALSSLRAMSLGRYFQHNAEIAKYDSLRTLVLAPPPPVVRDSAQAGDSTVVDSSYTVTAATLPPLDSINTRLAYNSFELAGLFYSNLVELDSAKKWYSAVIDRYPASSYAPRALFTLAYIYGQDSTEESGKDDSLYVRLSREYPKSEFSLEAARILGRSVHDPNQDESMKLYEAAETLVEIGDGEGAVRILGEIRERFPASTLAPKAIYMLGWIYENLMNNRDSAVAAYQSLTLLHPTSEYSVTVREKLSIALAEAAVADSAQPPASDSLDIKSPDPEKVPQDELDGISKEKGEVVDEPEKRNEEPKEPPPR